LPSLRPRRNWVDVLGTEPPDAPVIKPFGFIQPSYTRYDDKPLAGLGGAAVNANGTNQIQNLAQPTFEHSDQFQFLRAQFGLRGRLTDKINYFLLSDVGQNLTTVQHSVMLTDASSNRPTISIWHLRARPTAGIWKPASVFCQVGKSKRVTTNSTAIMTMQRPNAYSKPGRWVDNTFLTPTRG
jgi:hypothetical protein